MLSPSAVQARDRKLATLSETDKALDDLKRHRKELLDMLVRACGRVVHCSSVALRMLSACCPWSLFARTALLHMLVLRPKHHATCVIAKELQALQALQCLSGALSA